LQYRLWFSGIKEPDLVLSTFNKQVLPHDHLAAHRGVSFKALLAGKQGLRIPMRLKAILCEVEVRLRYDEPFIGKALKSEARSVVTNVTPRGLFCVRITAPGASTRLSLIKERAGSPDSVSANPPARFLL
jgi:hypothetical protein